MRKRLRSCSDITSYKGRRLKAKMLYVSLDAVCRAKSADLVLTELRIHDDIERGDNESVKNPKGGTVKVEKACS